MVVTNGQLDDDGLRVGSRHAKCVERLVDGCVVKVLALFGHECQQVGRALDVTDDVGVVGRRVRVDQALEAADEVIGDDLGAVAVLDAVLQRVGDLGAVLADLEAVSQAPLRDGLERLRVVPQQRPLNRVQHQN
jgi:hypothetical protein